MARVGEKALADLSVRVARAEMERDAAQEREQKAKAAERFAWRAYSAVTTGDAKKMLDTIQIMGIPARDIKAICEMVTTWEREGGDQSMVDWWKESTRKVVIGA